jgi:hypothetical protein
MYLELQEENFLFELLKFENLLEMKSLLEILFTEQENLNKWK